MTLTLVTFLPAVGAVLVLLLPASGDYSTVELLATRTCRTVSVGDLS